ncbi:MAG: P1 family peptidase [Actinomycetota bacterium]
MNATKTLGDGFRVGHWTDERALTGCTVVLPPHPNVTSCEIRGSSPSSRELVLLHPDRRLTEVHGVLLTGGSAFGLAAADGVVSHLAKQGIGYDTAVTPVPIVPAAVIFDLAVGEPDVRPDADAGRAACEAASNSPIATGRVGVGAGATVGKWAGREHASPGGLGVGAATAEGTVVRALAVVNSVGDVIAEDGSVLAGTTSPDPRYYPALPPEPPIASATVLAVVAVEGALDKRDVRWVAGRGADGITVAVRPAHTRYDGDVVFAIASPTPQPSPPNLDLIGVLATQAVAAAIRDAVA